MTLEWLMTRMRLDAEEFYNVDDGLNPPFMRGEYSGATFEYEYIERIDRYRFRRAYIVNENGENKELGSNELYALIKGLQG